MDIRQRKFVNEYLIHGNATRAYQTAYNCSREVAISNSSKLRHQENIAQAIERGKERMARRAEIKQDQIIDEMKIVGFANRTDAVKVVGGEVYVKDTNELEPELQQCIKSITQDKDGNVKIEFYDKLKALDMLAKTQDMYKETVEVNVDNDFAAIMKEARKRASENENQQDVETAEEDVD